MSLDIGRDLIIRMAESEREVAAAQRLRYQVFYRNMGARPSAEMARMERDFDSFDAICDHLLILDRSAGAADPKVVGTYRLLRGSRAASAGGYYSAGEFDLAPLGGFAGEHLELGRSCVDPDYRQGAVMQLLWKGIALYLKEHDISLMFGCASFPSTDVGEFAHALSYLEAHHAAPEAARPRARAGRHVPMAQLPLGAIDSARALREIPPLIKGYLRLGGMIGDGAVIDYLFNTLDVCLMVESRRLPERYLRHYLVEKAA